MADDAIVVFGSMGALDKRTCVEAVRAAGESWRDFSIDDVRTVRLTPDSAVVTYRADATPAGETEAKKYLGSSAYVRRGGKWLIAFHQQTPDTR